jgi:hypothetical protein
MPSWWDRVKARFGGRSTSSSQAEQAQQARAQWLPADATPFGIPVLDLISITGQMMSTTSNPRAAERAMSWTWSTGSELDTSGFAHVEARPCELRYPADPMLGDGLLFTPREMEHKWVLALRGDELLAARSWTGEVAAVASVRHEGDELVVHSLRIHEQAGFETFGEPVELFDWLVRSHALGQVWPLPVDAEGAELLEAVPLSVFGLFGHMAKCAARSWAPPVPERPLRSDGALMQAVRADDHARVRELLEAGATVDAPSPTLGLRPLAVAAIKGDLALVELLLSHGADPNLGDDRGLAPLGRAIVAGGDVGLLEVLRDAGARTDVVNDDGFNLLHAVAETNRPELVGWMIEHGVELEARTRHGHTPLHVSCGLGHVEAATALLRAGADPHAEAGGLDALAIARQENKPQVVALLERELA